MATDLHEPTSNEGTPEHNLWLAVLHTILQDARSAKRQRSEYKRQILIEEINSDRIQAICELIGENYDHLRKEVLIELLWSGA